MVLPSADLPPSTPEEVIEDLLAQAEVAADEMNEGNDPLAKVIEVPKWTAKDTIEWEAAQMIQRFVDALRRIASGEARNAAQTAKKALGED